MQDPATRTALEGADPSSSSSLGSHHGRQERSSALVDSRDPLTQSSTRHLLDSPEGPSSSSSPQVVPFASSLARDALLTYAYRLYETPDHPPTGLSHLPLFHSMDSASPQDVYRSQLIPLLVTLRSLHPNHLPTLLLLGCVHHAIGEYQSCLEINRHILSIDPNFVSRTHLMIIAKFSALLWKVEAMCNIGTTMKALSRPEDAYHWWWRALERRPTYWETMVCRPVFKLAHRC
jgi:protein O-GlcNAc transferase